MYVAFVVDVFARRIVGWRVSSSMQTDFVLDALEQVLYARRAERERDDDGDLVHHSDRGSQPAFNESSQHCVCRASVAACRMPRRAFASQGPFVVACSRPMPLPASQSADVH